MRLGFVSLFPNLIEAYFADSILGRARARGLFELDFFNPRDLAGGGFKAVDDYKIGGGSGQLLLAGPVCEAILAARARLEGQGGEGGGGGQGQAGAGEAEGGKEGRAGRPARVIFLNPAGKVFKHKDAKRLAREHSLIFVCGRYEGIDERAEELFANEVLSLGDFVLTGGELGALVICDAILRQLPGVLGNEASLREESFEPAAPVGQGTGEERAGDGAGVGLLEAPSFARPVELEGLKTRAILEFLKGNHSKIQALKGQLALAKTRYFRPDLFLKFQKEKR